MLLPINRMSATSTTFIILSFNHYPPTILTKMYIMLMDVVTSRTFDVIELCTLKATFFLTHCTHNYFLIFTNTTISKYVSTLVALFKWLNGLPISFTYSTLFKVYSYVPWRTYNLITNNLDNIEIIYMNNE